MNDNSMPKYKYVTECPKCGREFITKTNSDLIAGEEEWYCEECEEYFYTAIISESLKE